MKDIKKIKISLNTTIKKALSVISNGGIKIAIVVDKKNKPISYASLVFKGSNEGTLSDENGKFYLESKNTYTVLKVAFAGYTSKDVALSKSVNYNLKVIMDGEIVLKDVVIYKGKTSKNNYTLE